MSGAMDTGKTSHVTCQMSKTKKLTGLLFHILKLEAMMSSFTPLWDISDNYTLLSLYLHTEVPLCRKAELHTPTKRTGQKSNLNVQEHMKAGYFHCYFKGESPVSVKPASDLSFGASARLIFHLRGCHVKWRTSASSPQTIHFYEWDFPTPLTGVKWILPPRRYDLWRARLLIPREEVLQGQILWLDTPRRMSKPLNEPRVQCSLFLTVVLRWFSTISTCPYTPL